MPLAIRPIPTEKLSAPLVPLQSGNRLAFTLR